MRNSSLLVMSQWTEEPFCLEHTTKIPGWYCQLVRWNGILLLSYNEERRWKARRDWGRGVITRPVLLRSPHAILGICLVKWRGSPVRSSDVVVVENGQRWGQKQRESVGPVVRI
jgi:hypothetical protein